MSTRILILFITALSMFTLLIAANPQSKGEYRDTTTGSKTQHTRTRATAKIIVHSSEAKPYDQTTSPALTEIHMSEIFAGDIDGESTVRALALQRDDKSANQVSIQRFIGKLAGRQGAFVLEGSEIVKNGNIKATWFAVPGSGTGDLSGLRGEGGFEGGFGIGSDGWLDYWFE